MMSVACRALGARLVGGVGTGPARSGQAMTGQAALARRQRRQGSEAQPLAFGADGAVPDHAVCGLDRLARFEQLPEAESRSLDRRRRLLRRSVRSPSAGGKIGRGIVVGCGPPLGQLGVAALQVAADVAGPFALSAPADGLAAQSLCRSPSVHPFSFQKQ